jgi:hypothetical protein
MKWLGRRESSNVDNRRSSNVLKEEEVKSSVFFWGNHAFINNSLL